MISTLTPDTRLAVEGLLAEGARAGIEAKIVSARRTCAQQAAIYASNTPEKKVTGARGCRSWHVWGRAVDLEVKPASRYKDLAEIARRLGFVWGGNFQGLYDPGHFEYHPGLDINDLCPDSSDEACQGQVSKESPMPPTPAAAAECTKEFTPEYLQKLKHVFVREWVRLNGGEPTDYDARVARGESPATPPEVLLSVGQCVEAMQTSGVIPGVWQSPEDQQCYQDWTTTGCFARFYMGSDPAGKAEIIGRLARGDSFTSESRIYACPEGQVPSRDCCGSSTWADPLYMKWNSGVEEGKKGWNPWLLLGIGLAGIGVVWLAKNR